MKSKINILAQKTLEMIDEINNIISKLSSGKKIVYTYGAWDLIHPGHLIFLNRAKELGDYLIVGTVADKPIKELKGEERPVQKADDRNFLVSNFKCVDASLIQSEYDPSDILTSLLRVDILTKGDDWEYIPGQETIEKLGGKLVKLGYSKSYSTSSTISRISGNKVAKNKEY